MPARLERADARHHVPDPRDQREDSRQRHRDIQKIDLDALARDLDRAIEEIQLQQHHRDRHHLQRRRRLSGRGGECETVA